MAGVVKEITYGDLWGGKKAAQATPDHHHGRILACIETLDSSLITNTS
jgi:hypothetical protein